MFLKKLFGTSSTRYIKKISPEIQKINDFYVKSIKELSNNKLSIDVEKVNEMNLFFKVTKERGSKSKHYHSKKNFKSNRPFRKRRM